jgi:hypothetical protein
LFPSFRNGKEKGDKLVTTEPLKKDTSSEVSGSPVDVIVETPLEAIHDASQQAKNLRHVLEEGKQRIGCFLGAGCPLGIYDADGKTSMVLIPAVEELTKRVALGLETRDKEIREKTPGGSSGLKQAWDSLCKECTEIDKMDPTVEDVLTELRTLANRRGNTEILGLNKEALNNLDMEICSLIVAEMNKSLPRHRNSYNRFASWIGGLHSLSPVEIFTPNYDLLFEQAFEQHPLPHFDGFVGSREPWFDLASIEHDTIPARWTRLWKLHGSINWEKIEEDISGKLLTRIVRVAREATKGKVMIYPSHLKFDQSRRMPYLAMLDRLRAFFRGGPIKKHSDTDKREEDAPRLIICGYSFLDDHLNEIMLDGLRGNRSAQCFALMYGKLSDHPRAVDFARKQGNLTVLARDGAVVGTRVGRYKPGSCGGDEQKPWLYEEDSTTVNPDKLERQPKSNLGDFHYYGLFLEKLCDRSNSDESTR